MLRGIIAGLFWGCFVAALVAGVASLTAPLPATVTPQTETSAMEGTLPGGDLERSALGSNPDGSLPDPSAPAASPGSEDASPLADTASAPRPATGDVEAGLATPAPTSETDAPEMADSSDAPVISSGPAAPAAPVVEDDLSISTDPVQPSVPEVADSAFTETETEAAPAEADATDEAPEIATPAVDQAPAVTIETPQPALPEAEPEPAFTPDASASLPSIGGEAPAAPVSGDRAIDRFAVPFDLPEGQPPMAIVLIDDGSAGIQAEALASFPYPLTFAVNTLDPEVKDKMAAYREKGFEVLAMVDLPAAATASDVEVAMAAHLAAVPEAVGVIEGTRDGLQGSKEISDQVTAVVQQSGHGLVFFPQGLDTARKLASKEGVPAATVFRDFDSKGQDATVIRRFLDQAAFRAGVDGGVIMVGRLRPDTVNALLLWGLQDRARTVALAPVSALLTTGEAEAE